MITQTKTRSVPVTKYRSETKQIKQADGSVKSETVKVPYTENVQQNFTVQVPYTENVQQTYQLRVPYTADGKRIDKSDFGKYGLKENGQLGNDSGLERERLTVPPVIQKALVRVTDGHPSGDPSDSASGSETIDLPNADTWRGQQLRRAKYPESRLDGRLPKKQKWLRFSSCSGIQMAESFQDAWA